MSGEFEAAGGMATAGLIGGAIEGREPHEAGEGACLNCGAPLQGRFCHACGQAARPHRTLGHVFEEFLHGVVHFDTKAWRTLPMLAFRPGTLTRNYIYGKRARYISPLAMFLFTIFFMFAVFAFVGTPTPDFTVSDSTNREEAVATLDASRGELAEAEAELARVIANPSAEQPRGLEERLARMEVGLAQNAVTRAAAALARVDAAIARAAEGASAEGETVNPDGSVQVTRNSEDMTWQEAMREVAQGEDFVLIQGWDSFNEKAREKLLNPDLALYKIQQAAYKFSFLLVPISLPFIALLFLWKRGLTFYDHVIYALYALSFASILFVAIAQVAAHTWTQWLIPWLLFAALPVHTFFHLKGAYALGWWSALWRTFFMLTFASLALGLFIFTIVLLGLAG